MVTQRDRLGLRLAALFTALVGVVNLISAVTPSLPERVAWLKPIFPFPVRAGGHFFAATTGFILLTLATHLLRRKHVAWLLTMGLLVISILSHLLKGLDYEESLLAGVLLVQLWLMRSLFTAQSDRPSIAQGLQTLVAALLFTLAYGTAGFFLMDRQYTVEFNFPEAVMQTLAMFFTEDGAGLQPKTRFGQFFADSIYLVGATTLGYALFMLLRPVLSSGTATPAERQQAKAIASEHGNSGLVQLCLLSDKSYYFSPSGQSVIAYVPQQRGAIALGDPIGPLTERSEAIIGFQQLCERNDWYPAFYQTPSESLDLYRALGFHTLQIGESAIVDLSQFTLKGKANQNLRTACNRLSKQGATVEIYQPPIPLELLSALRPVSDEWLHLVKGAEKRFSVGWFDEAYLRECAIAVVYTAEGKITAFANLITQYQHQTVTVDLMRRRLEVESGTMEFLFATMLQHYQQLGYAKFDLGLSALSQVNETVPARKLDKGLHYLYEHLNRFYNFKGLHSFKNKFQPCWEPRYLVYPGLSALPDVVIGLIQADSGGRWQDYFKFRV